MTDFTFLGSPYQFAAQGGQWNIQALVNGVPTFNNLVSGFINIGDNNLSGVQPFTPGASVPEPATMLLLGSGLLGLVGLRRKYKN